MDRRSTPRTDWTVGRDDQGRAVLVWRLTSDQDLGADATADDVLDALGVPGLALEENTLLHRERGFDPYNLSAPRIRRRK